MPQIFLTYNELREAFGADFADPRAKAMELGLAKIKTSDGTHVRLSQGMAYEYLSGLLAAAAGTERQPVHNNTALEALMKPQIALARLIAKRAA